MLHKTHVHWLPSLLVLYGIGDILWLPSFCILNDSISWPIKGPILFSFQHDKSFYISQLQGFLLPYYKTNPLPSCKIFSLLYAQMNKYIYFMDQAILHYSKKGIWSFGQSTMHPKQSKIFFMVVLSQGWCGNFSKILLAQNKHRKVKHLQESELHAT